MEEGLVLVFLFLDGYENPTFRFITFVTHALGGMITWSEHINKAFRLDQVKVSLMENGFPRVNVPF